MRLLALGLNILFAFNLAAGSIFPVGSRITSVLRQSEPAVRIDGFGIDMNALPALTVDNVEKMMNRVAKTGAIYIRQEINWSFIETSADVYDWSAVVPLDLLVAAASARDIKIVAVLTGGPAYLAASGQSVDRTALRERWVKFVQAAVEHFGEQVDIWEIGSAVNSSYALTPYLAPLSPDQAIEPSAALYSKLVSSAADVIKGVDPNDQVWLGTLTGLFDPECAMNPLTFILELNANKTWNDFDAILYQPAQGSAAPEYPSSGSINSACASNLMAKPASLTEELRAVQELARQLGGKPVLVSGLGWGSAELSTLSANREISPDQVEADLLVRASASLMSQNSIPVIFWNSDIVTNRSAQRALTNLQHSLAKTKPLGRVMAEDPSVHEYHFRKGGEQLIIAWHAQDGDSAYQTVLNVSDLPSLTAWAADAESLSRETGNVIPSKGIEKIPVTLTERPVIFSGRTGDLILNIKYTVEDQVELVQIELSRLMKLWFNEAKKEFVKLLEKELDEAKNSALEWGEDKIDELLP